MKYRNTHPTSGLEFSFGKEQFSVPVGETVEIDDKWAPWVVSRGLYLEVVKDEPVVVEAKSEPVKVEAKADPKPEKPAK